MSLSDAERARWAEIDSLVADHKTSLKAASTHEDLKEFATEHGLMNKKDFGKYKVSLRKIGVDYESLREKTFKSRDNQRVQQLADLPEAVPTVRLWTAAVEKDTKASFAIVDAENTAVWYGDFFPNDYTRVPGDIVSAEQSVIEKAIWIAHKAITALGGDVGRVIITTNYPDFDSDDFAAAAVKNGVAVEIVVDPDDTRALDMAQAPGYQRWQDTNLADLVEDMES